MCTGRDWNVPTGPPDRWTRRNRLLAGLGLTGLALVGNMQPVSLFFGVDYLFGSVAVLLAAVWFGPWIGLAVGSIGALYTVILWGHAWAVVIFAAEAFAVGWWTRSGRDLIVADGMFWMVLGLPFVFLAYGLGMAMTWEQTVLIALKQPVNGLFNALAANFILLALRAKKSVAVRPLAFNLLFGGIFTTGLLLLAFQAHALRDAQEAAISAHLRSVERLQTRFSESDETATERWLGAEHPSWFGRGERRARGGGLTVHLPPDASLAEMTRWRQAVYALGTNAAGQSDLPILRSARPLVDRVTQYQMKAHAVLLALALLGTWYASAMARRLSGPFERLDESVDAARAGWEREEQPHTSFPVSDLEEARRLGVAFERLTERLREGWTEAEASRQSLLEAQQIAKVGSWRLAVDTGAIEWSPQVYRMFGRQPDAVSPTFDLFVEHVHPDDRAAVQQAVEASIAEAVPGHLYYRILGAEGCIRYVEARWETDTTDDGQVDSLAGTILNITELEQARRRAEKEAKVNEALVSELHHRVKNNLQIIVSMVSMTTAETDDERSVRQLREVGRRIRAVAQVHEMLYQSDSRVTIDLSSYLRNVVGYLMQAVGREEATSVDLQLASVQVDTDTAVCCGLIVNELVMNAFKHGVAEGADGLTVQVNLEELDEGLRLSIRDNGPGFGPDFELASSGRLGLTLVRALVGQLGGEWQVINDDGACITVRAPLDG